MDSSTHLRTTSNGSAEAQAGAIPLIDISRTPSPYPRARSAAQSEDEDEDYEPAASLVRPLVASDAGNGREGRTWQRITRNGGLGKFFFGTWVGWQIYVGLLVFWVAGTSFYLLLMNRFILLTGVYKFPYPLTMTWIQLVLEHIILLGFASLTRLLARQFQILGLGAVVAPATPLSAGSAHRTAKGHGYLAGLARWITGGSGGIAGGGLFEFEWSTAKKVLPLAVVYMAKVVLSNISFAYAAQETYTLARIGVVPLSLILASTSSRSSLSVNSVPTLSSALTAAFSLLVACFRSGVRVTWESILAGVFSSLFVAVYPIILLRTYRMLVNDMVPQGDVLTGFPSADGGDEPSATREETRAYWRTLHYTSILTLIILSPIVLLSGELSNIHHNCYFLDVPFFWFLTLCGGIGAWAVFTSTLLLTKATSPLTVNFISVPRGAFELMCLNHFKLPVHSWLGVGFCWVASGWFLVARRDEGRTLDRMRLEGR
ncbi:hypothetical protein BKA80DRAFT_278854 [Phyllosticta citrichinensis]